MLQIEFFPLQFHWFFLGLFSDQIIASDGKRTSVEKERTSVVCGTSSLTNLHFHAQSECSIVVVYKTECSEFPFRCLYAKVEKFIEFNEECVQSAMSAMSV